MLRYHRQQHGNLRYQCRTRRRQVLRQPRQLLRAVSPEIPAVTGFAVRRTPGKQTVGIPADQNHCPLKILGRQDDFRSLTADCPATLTPERRAARQQDAQTEDHLVADGQRPEAQHQPQGQDDGQYRKQTTGVITHLLSLPCYLRHHL